MGVWGVGAFQNDDAADWLLDLAETSDLSLVQSSLAKVISQADYLELPDGAAGVAAAEAIACLLGKPDPNVPSMEEVDGWLATIKVKASGELVGQAGKALDRIMGENSELVELWKESTEFDEWSASIANLRTRLG